MRFCYILLIFFSVVFQLSDYAVAESKNAEDQHTTDFRENVIDSPSITEKNPIAVEKSDPWALIFSLISLLIAMASPIIYWKIYKFERQRHDNEIVERGRRNDQDKYKTYWTDPILIPLFVIPLRDFSITQLQCMDKLSGYEGLPIDNGIDVFKEKLQDFNNELHQINEKAVILKAMDERHYKKWRVEVEKAEDIVTHYCAANSLKIENTTPKGNSDAKSAIISLLTNVAMDLMSANLSKVEGFS